MPLKVLQHLQSQATEKMEDLTISMGKTGADSQNEAILMRIITVVTLIYLPATFVSVSSKPFATYLTFTKYPEDFLQYRCYQISKPKWE